MTDRPTGPPVRSYRTSFQTDENPISEGGIWLNGRKDGIDWADVITRNGGVYGAVTRMAVAERRVEQGNLDPAAGGAAPEGDYDDPTAVLAGVWGPDQYARAGVFSRNPTEEYFQEVEIRLRSTIAPHLCTGYEVFFRCLKTEEGYAEIVRWNGKIGDFTSLAKLSGPEYGVEDGDVIEASIVGSAIKGYINGVEMISAADDVFSQGGPGSGSTSSSATPTSTTGSRTSRWTPTTAEPPRRNPNAEAPRPGVTPARPRPGAQLLGCSPRPAHGRARNFRLQGRSGHPSGGDT